MLPSSGGSAPSSGIFSDASIIAQDRYDSTRYDSARLSQHTDSEASRFLLEDGIVLSPHETQMFKKVHRIVLENKSLRNTIIDNSKKLQVNIFNGLAPQPSPVLPLKGEGGK